FLIDAHKRELIWENGSASVDASTRSSSIQGNGLTGRTAAEILWHLFATDPRYSQLVSSFRSLSSLESEFTFLQSLQTEADQAVAKEQRIEEQQKAQMRAAEGRQTRFDSSATIPPRSTHSAGKKASWDSLIIPQQLRENLQAYVKVLRDYAAYQA